MSFSATSQAAGVYNFASGSFTSTNVATTITTGFRPRYVKVINSTGVVVIEKIEGMAAANAVNTVTAGTTTINTSSLITFTATGFVLSATAVGNAQAISWVAMA